MNTWFTADTHFGHANIIRYCKRPFGDVNEMNEAIIANWNSVVAPKDTIYHLGDFAFGITDGDFDRYYNRLNGGTIIFIKGNHDRLAWKNRYKFYSHSDSYREIVVDGQAITLCHYAMRVWNKSHYGSWNLYGHSHGTLPDNPNALQMDVGVDCNGFTPVSFQQIKEIMAKKTFKPIDHHGNREHDKDKA